MVMWRTRPRGTKLAFTAKPVFTIVRAGLFHEIISFTLVKKENMFSNVVKMLLYDFTPES